MDDSANKRLSVPEAFLAVDAILNLYINVVRGMKVYPAVIRQHLEEELPFMATENIMMYCVKNKNGDRQVLHEAIRQHSVKAAEQDAAGDIYRNGCTSMRQIFKRDCGTDAGTV